MVYTLSESLDLNIHLFMIQPIIPSKFEMLKTTILLQLQWLNKIGKNILPGKHMSHWTSPTIEVPTSHQLMVVIVVHRDWVWLCFSSHVVLTKPFGRWFSCLRSILRGKSRCTQGTTMYLHTTYTIMLVLSFRQPMENYWLYFGLDNTSLPNI